MIDLTTDFDKFKFRTDNRAEISENHVNKLIESIKERNLLHLRPIVVNTDMEILDGQHRFLAAKKLGVPIYFQIQKDFKIDDIIVMNTNKTWGVYDYLNFYCKNGYIEYQKLDAFIKKHNLQLKVALRLINGAGKQAIYDYKHGAYVFKDEGFNDIIDKIHQTIDIITLIKGYSYYLKTGRFWSAISIMMNTPDFDNESWTNNLKKFIYKMDPRSSIKEYLKLFSEIYNWKKLHKLEFEYGTERD